jgi:parallel beta-helix repeat protein
MKSIHTSIAVAVLTSLAGLAQAGPLNPPAGPVAPTMKTLSEVEPRKAISYENAPGDNTVAYKIANPGSYYLTGDLYVPPGMNGIQIASSPVTIDLNAFMIYGLQGSHDGITTTGVGSGAVIKNGTVTYFGIQGINLAGWGRSQIQDVNVYACTGNGISVGSDCTLSNCNVSYSSHMGISAYSDCTLTECKVSHCTQVGITVGDRCTLDGCTSSYNQSGFSGTTKDVFEHCSASENTLMGFNLGSSSTVRDCQALHNSQQGIVATDNCTIIGNQCRANGGTALASIWAMGNSNTIQNNQTGDSGYGIYVNGNFNTISGNVMTAPAQRAVFVDGTSNLIVQNTAYSTVGGFWIVAFNRVGPVIQPAYTLQAITGFGGSGIGLTDPYANLIIN